MGQVIQVGITPQYNHPPDRFFISGFFISGFLPIHLDLPHTQESLHDHVFTDQWRPMEAASATKAPMTAARHLSRSSSFAMPWEYSCHVQEGDLPVTPMPYNLDAPMHELMHGSLGHRAEGGSNHDQHMMCSTFGLL